MLQRPRKLLLGLDDAAVEHAVLAPEEAQRHSQRAWQGLIVQGLALLCLADGGEEEAALRGLTEAAVEAQELAADCKSTLALAPVAVQLLELLPERLDQLLLVLLCPTIPVEF